MDHHYFGCGTCPHCLDGWSQLCREGFLVYGATAHGAHAPYMKVPARTLVPLPEELSFTTGAAISCGTGTAFGALRRLDIGAGDTIAIFGQGPVGLSATQLASAMGAKVIALDIGSARLARAQEFGAEHRIDPGSDDPVDAIKALTGGVGADLTLECSGAPEARVAADHRRAVAAQAHRLGPALDAVELEIAAAHARGLDLQHHLAGSGHRVRKLLELELALAQKHHAAHGLASRLAFN
jgi:D-arabinose 1-dehydrogenase-like Zn-dependent alcohol dehydrogenase